MCACVLVLFVFFTRPVDDDMTTVRPQPATDVTR